MASDVLDTPIRTFPVMLSLCHTSIISGTLQQKRQKYLKKKYTTQYVQYFRIQQNHFKSGGHAAKRQWPIENNIAFWFSFLSFLTLLEFLEVAVARQQSQRHRTTLEVVPPCYAGLELEDSSSQGQSCRRMGMCTWQGKKVQALKWLGNDTPVCLPGSGWFRYKKEKTVRRFSLKLTHLRKQLTGDATSRFAILRKSMEKQKWWADGSIGSLVPSDGTVRAGIWGWGAWPVILVFLGGESCRGQCTFINQLKGSVQGSLDTNKWRNMSLPCESQQPSCLQAQVGLGHCVGCWIVVGVVSHLGALLLSLSLALS